MSAHNLRSNLALAALCAVLPSIIVVRRASATPPTPALDVHDRRFLAQGARRAVDALSQTESVYEPAYVPASIRDVSGFAVVTLRRQGKVLGVGSSGPGPIVPATVQAAVTAAVDAAVKHQTDPLKPIDGLLIETEITGAEEQVALPDRWLRPGALESVLQPGVDGFCVRIQDVVKRVCPGELCTKNVTLSDALRKIVESTERVPDDLQLSRFRTAHWYQSARGDDVVSLVSGMTPVRPSDVTHVSVDGALDRIVDHLLKRRMPNGAFQLEYAPATGKFSHKDDPLAQAGVIWAAALAADRIADPRLRTAVESMLQAQLARSRELDDVEAATFVPSRDERHRLTLTAYTCLAASVFPYAERFAEQRSSLITGVLWLQEPSGEFLGAFPPARRVSRSIFDTGIALTALAAEYEYAADAEILNAVQRAAAYCNRADQRERHDVSLALAARAAAITGVAAGRPDLARIAFDLIDGLVRDQRTARSGHRPELVGGFVDRASSMPTVESALGLAALIEAATAAERFDDPDRRDRYRAAAHRAARFVLQLEMKPAETYYIEHPEHAVGGIRTSPSDSRMRLENLQYALIGLLAYRDMLDRGR